LKQAGRTRWIPSTRGRSLARLKPLIREKRPYSKRIAQRGIRVEPERLAEIEYRAKSAEGKVWQPLFKGMREDPKAYFGHILRN
jgi:bifunctional non-homologous end joining protein LigD